MLGMGESRIGAAGRSLQDLRRAGCALLTLGQYLAPTGGHHPVARW